jgi:outer membrane immunogenic protein
MHVGWTLGGGLEWALSRNLSIKAEYLYVNLGEEHHKFVGTARSGLVSVGGGMFDYRSDGMHQEIDLHTVRLGLNYRFGG